MKKYLVIYHAPAKAMEMMAKATPAQKAEGMKPWMEWAQSCGAGLVDMGAPLMGGQRVKPDGSWSKSTKAVTGYSVLQAANLTGAKKMLKKHPHLKWTGGCAIEIHEMAAM